MKKGYINFILFMALGATLAASASGISVVYQPLSFFTIITIAVLFIINNERK